MSKTTRSALASSENIDKGLTSINNNELNNCTSSIQINDDVLSPLAGESILETLERHKVDANYACREGYCGVCRKKLLEGKVEYTLDPLAYIDDDEFLSCCTKAVGNIKIE